MFIYLLPVPTSEKRNTTQSFFPSSITLVLEGGIPAVSIIPVKSTESCALLLPCQPRLGSYSVIVLVLTCFFSFIT